MILTSAEWIRFIVSVLLFPVFAFSFKAVPDNYPELHKQNRFISYNGFNMAFMDFEKEPWLRFKKSMFRHMLIAGAFQLALCLLCFLVFPQWDKKTVIESCAAVLGLTLLCDVVYKLIKMP